MTSKKLNKEAYVWIWLPGATSPIVAGKVVAEGRDILFNYGKSYLERENKISIYDKELPLRPGRLTLLDGLSMPSCIRDASPDAWGRRVLMNKRFGSKSSGIDTVQIDEITYLLESGSDRIGALDFQRSPTEYIPRASVNVSLDELLESAKRVEQGVPLSPELDQALHHGSSIGGARPKALIESGNMKYVAKFSASSDVYNVVKAEFIAMRLAKLVGLNVAEVFLTQSSHKDVLLIKRFDRIHSLDGWERRCMVSALTLFELDELMARYASYERLAEIVRYNFRDASKTLRELFSRLVFNILVGNTDDHARNHAAFWDGEMLSLTPAYDICPQSRAGNEATQAMLISGSERMSKLSCCIEAAHHFLLSQEDACQLMAKQQQTIEENWLVVCDEAELSEVERTYLWQRQILNPFSFGDIK
ncbi:MAG: HipA domain-containing protein [Ghiorsea sp.]